ncbi:hypothetical protein RND81_13G154900 [Saponaria officinalis]|uniref:Uncharacterized protein n=1 Tax=Saponaria officinalis TaxID=3572 RepID=A0AAW1H5V0_SAPOF
MENPSHEDEPKVTGLVDYSSSSEDDNDENPELSPTKGPNDSRSDTSLSQSKNESPAPLLKKQRLNDSVSDGGGSSNSDLKEKEDLDTDSDEDFDPYDDNDVLQWGQYSWRRADRLYGRQVYCVGVDGESPCEESKCLELLDEIGCMDRYLGCSVEMSRVFFANLIKDEAARLQGLDGVEGVIPRRRVISDV